MWQLATAQVGGAIDVRRIAGPHIKNLDEDPRRNTSQGERDRFQVCFAHIGPFSWSEITRRLLNLDSRHTHQAKTNEQRLAYAKPMENNNQRHSVQDDGILKKLPRKPYEDKNRRHEKSKG